MLPKGPIMLALAAIWQLSSADYTLYQAISYDTDSIDGHPTQHTVCGPNEVVGAMLTINLNF